MREVRRNFSSIQTAEMGKIMQKATVENLFDVECFERGTLQEMEIRKLELEFLVDTGAAMLCLPTSAITHLGLTKRRTHPVITATGTTTGTIYSPVVFCVFNREAEVQVMEIPDGVPPLIGYLVMEALDLVPNPLKGALEGNPAHDGKLVLELL
jgi:predicted aspartyl protease